ncbi:MAG: hypothetical protein IJ318_02590 [Clostridia bacterium]|nr:hypothetical protein [Clostridia bacterium]
MKLNQEQTQLVGLTMQLELKTKEYKMLCKELDDLKAQGIDPDDPMLINLRGRFLKNNQEIAEINKKLKKLQ